MKMTKEQEKQFKAEFEKQLLKQYSLGMIKGTKVMLSVILDKIKEHEKNNSTSETILNDIRKYCEFNLSDKKKQ